MLHALLPSGHFTRQAASPCRSPSESARSWPLASVVIVPGIAAAKPLTGNVACTLSGTAVISPGLPLANDPPVTATKTYTSTTTFTGTLSNCTGEQQNINTKKGFGPIDHGTTTAVGKTKYKKGMNLPDCIGLTSPSVTTVLKATTLFMDASNNLVGKSVAKLTVGAATLGPPTSFPSTGTVSGGNAFKKESVTVVANLSNAGGPAGACNAGASTTFIFDDGTSTLDIH